MKRFFILFLSFLLFTYGISAKDVSSANISSVVLSVEGVKLDNDEASWLCQVVADKLDENLSKYTDLTVVNSDDKKQIIDIQKENDDFIEVGKINNASHIIFLKITKTRSNYVISLKLTDLTTSENIVSLTSSGRKDPSRLYTGHGCAIDELTIKFCDELGIELSQLDKLIIMEGEENLSMADKNRVYESDITLYNSKIKALDKEIEKLNKSSKIEDVAKKNALEAKKAEAEERLKIAAAKRDRSLKDEQKRKDDELKDKNRSAEQINKINDMTNNLNSKIEELRSKRQEELSLIKRAEIIEMKKKSYLETKVMVEEELDKREKDIIKKREDDLAAIDAKKYRNAELKANGEPTKQALENREKMKAKALNNIEKTDVASRDAFKKEWTGKIENLAKEIKKDYKTLKTEKISTLNDELVITYNKYDGEREGWPLTVSVQIDNILLLETSAFLPYEDVTGKKTVKDIDSKNHEDFDDFADTVDFYDSLFLQGKQILTYSLEYSIAPSRRSLPSSYDITFSNFCFYDTETLKVRGNVISSSPKGKLKLDKSVVTKQFYPIYDMRTESEIAEDERYEAERQKAIEEEERRRQEAIAAEEARKLKAIEEEEAAQQRKIEERERKEELQEIKRQQNEEKARERDEKVSEIKEGIGSFFNETGDTILGAIDYHNSNIDTSIISAKFEAVGGGVTGSGFEINYTYGLGEHLFVGTSLDVIFSNSSDYYGLTDINTGAIIFDLIEFGYRHSLEDLLFSLFYITDWDIFSCPNLYYSGGLGWGICNPVETPASGSFLVGAQIGIETTLLNTITFISETELVFNFGHQDISDLMATTCINFDIGLGYKF